MPQINEGPVIEKSTQKLLDAKIRQAERLNKKLEAKKKALKREEQRLDCLLSEIGNEMVDAKLKRYVGAGGMSLVVVTPQRKWSLEKLETVLTRKEFDTYCPPKPAAGALGDLLESLKKVEDAEQVKKLERCFDETTNVQILIASPAELEKRSEKVESEFFDKDATIPEIKVEKKSA